MIFWNSYIKLSIFLKQRIICYSECLKIEIKFKSICTSRSKSTLSLSAWSTLQMSYERIECSINLSHYMLFLLYYYLEITISRSSIWSWVQHSISLWWAFSSDISAVLMMSNRLWSNDLHLEVKLTTFSLMLNAEDELKIQSCFDSASSHFSLNSRSFLYKSTEYLITVF